MENKSNSDVNLNVLGVGCASSCGSGCIVLILIMVLALAIGVPGIYQNGFLPLAGFLLGAIASIAVGFFVARAAIHYNVGVYLHVIIYGVVSLVIGAITLVSPNQNLQQFDKDVQGLMKMMQLISWLITIPLMLLGAYWAQMEDENK